VRERLVRSEERVRRLGEVFTPAATVSAMLDLLPDSVWRPSATFLEPSCGSGNFLVAILERKLRAVAREHAGGALAAAYDAALEALASLHGVDLAPDNILGSDGARARVLAALDAWHVAALGGPLPADVARAAARVAERNLRVGDALQDDVSGAAWDVIVGNPPYQREDGGHGRSATPLYHAFVRRAVALAPRFVLMIVPSRWMGGGKGLDAFRAEMLRDRRIAVLVDHTDARAVFPAVDVAGGVCYFLWAREHDGPCRMTSDGPAGRTTAERELGELDILVRGNEAMSIVRKVRARARAFMDARVSARKPFGLDTTARPAAAGELTLRWQHGEGPLPRSAVTRGAHRIDRWKVVASYAGFEHAGTPGADGLRRVLSVVAILPPGVVCNETYLVVGDVDTRAQAESLRSYLHTRFVRFLLAQRCVSQHLTRGVYAFVPEQAWDRTWTDAELYAAYGLDAGERAVVEGTVRGWPLTP
jgi:site-specific DNA-methyltransferase (adenine-specific)